MKKILLMGCNPNLKGFNCCSKDKKYPHIPVTFELQPKIKIFNTGIIGSSFKMNLYRFKNILRNMYLRFFFDYYRHNGENGLIVFYRKSKFKR